VSATLPRATARATAVAVTAIAVAATTAAETTVVAATAAAAAKTAAAAEAPPAAALSAEGCPAGFGWQAVDWTVRLSWRLGWRAGLLTGGLVGQLDWFVWLVCRLLGWQAGCCLTWLVIVVGLMKLGRVRYLVDCLGDWW